jgi:hypothetical protein
MSPAVHGLCGRGGAAAIQEKTGLQAMSKRLVSLPLPHSGSTGMLQVKDNKLLNLYPRIPHPFNSCQLELE